MNNVLMDEIEEQVAQLSADEQRLLLRRLTHKMRKDVSDRAERKRVMMEMAQDPDIQRELKAINEEFACTHMDGLE